MLPAKSITKNIRRELESKRATTFDRLLAYQQGMNIELTEEEAAMLRRWEYANRLALEAYAPSQIGAMLQKEFGIAARTAMYDVGNAEKMFGSIRRGSAEGKVAVLYELSMMALKKCIDSGDMEYFSRILPTVYKMAGGESLLKKAVGEMGASLADAPPVLIQINGMQVNLAELSSSKDKDKGIVLDAIEAEDMPDPDAE